MIDFIKGYLVEKGPGYVVVENHGTGYKIEVPSTDSVDNWVEGKEIKVYTRLAVREEEIHLYGFAGAEERNLFNLITGVSGFGPRVALSILGIVSASKFYVAILDEDLKTLCNIPGIGRKTAQRLILELKEKLPQVFPTMQSELEGAEEPISPVTANNKDEAISALCSLGYSQTEALEALESLQSSDKEDASTEMLIKMALKKLANR